MIGYGLKGYVDANTYFHGFSSFVSAIIKFYKSLRSENLMKRHSVKIEFDFSLKFHRDVFFLSVELTEADS